MARLAYVCVRPQTLAAHAEHESFQIGTGRDELAVLDLVARPLAPDAFDRFDAFLVGGSPFNVTDPEDAKSDTQRRLEADLETIAARAADGTSAALFTCYGIGIVTRMLGGTVSREYPEDTGPTTVQVTEDAASDPVFSALPGEFAALTAHKEGAGAVPPGATLLATNEACPVQGYRVGDRLYTTQFHPEPTPQAFTERMAIYREDGYFPASEYDVLAARVLAASVTAPAVMLRAFADRYA
jgi:GMP synthase (glutamine-hydrolysing)